jgi:hypothetical protein
MARIFRLGKGYSRKDWETVSEVRQTDLVARMSVCRGRDDENLGCR